MELGFDKPSPAISFVGRHNSGKTTLIVKVISELVSRGLNIGSIKHHGHPDFDIDYPGKDSYRHREAGSCDVVVISPARMARITEIHDEPSCDEVVASMPNHDLVIVEGYRQSGLPVIEVLRQGNERDIPAAEQLCTEGHVRGVVPVAVVTDMESVVSYAKSEAIPCFDIDDVQGVADFLQNRYARPKLTVAIQAGGESRRMGQSKATVPFLGRPLIERIVERVAPVADEIVITTNEAENLTFLDALDLHCDLRLVPDVYEERGALRGLYSALSAASNPCVAVVACDMVFASAPLIAHEAVAMQMRGVDAVVPCNRFGFEPFHAVYRADACLPAISDAIAQRKVRARDFYECINLSRFGREDIEKAAPGGGCFANVNTPEELARMERSIQENGDR